MTRAYLSPDKDSIDYRDVHLAFWVLALTFMAGFLMAWVVKPGVARADEPVYGISDGINWEQKIYEKLDEISSKLDRLPPPNPITQMVERSVRKK